MHDYSAQIARYVEKPLMMWYYRSAGACTLFLPGSAELEFVACFTASQQIAFAHLGPGNKKVLI